MIPRGDDKSFGASRLKPRIRGLQSGISFIGFMPVTNPRFTMMVILNNPQVSAGNRFGSILAAPIWKQMAEMMIDAWRIEP